MTLNQHNITELILHELKAPLVAIRGLSELLSRELSSQRTYLTHDYVGEIKCWCDLLTMFVENAQLILLVENDRPLYPRLSCTMLQTDVIIPVTKLVDTLLKGYEFLSTSIRFVGFEQVPPMYVDREMMRQVFFSMLGNAIDYAYKDPDSFQVDIEVRHESGNWVFIFRDWGRGFPDGWEVKVFEECTTDSGKETYYISYTGLCLWMVRRLVQAHKGTLQILKLRWPTEFRMNLLEELCAPWSKTDKEMLP